MESYRKPVKSDCEALLSRFQQTQSVRFEVFSNIWKEMKFVQIFRQSHNKRAFCRLVLDVAYCYFMPPFSFQIRVGGLYLLYSFYHCQTTSPPEQIRVALKDWEDVRNFEKESLDAQHLDVAYILQQLMTCKAFLFTAMPTLLHYSRKRTEEKPELCDEFMERPCRPQELINTQLSEEMSNIHELYKNTKASISSQMSTAAAASVSLIRGGIVSELCSAVMEFYNWQQNRDTVDEAQPSQERISSQQECSNRATLLAAIKSKAYEEPSEAVKSRRHRQVEIDLPAEEDKSFLKLRHSRVTKLSLKNRTKEQIHMSGDLGREAARTTLINHLVTLEPALQEKIKNERRFKSLNEHLESQTKSTSH
ncbi:snRNA-activating protein complex subunit 1-like [Xiphophorus hellerii]|uniref:snRNA-activating protein complex subunit 1-like n=1 Tax=Xiphophorus hellerii TaxID=8084 RepID=UPI0013B45665|nr:snRNA-activating protein complex subunit 1-like [Xiphophorus hellerii]